jgi:type II secretory pathway component PulF
MRFEFKAFDETGNVITSSIDAKSKGDALSILNAKKLRLISIGEEGTSGAPKFSMKSLSNLFSALNKKQPKITTEVLCTFFEKLQKMLAAGLTLSDSMQTIHKSTGSDAEKLISTKLLSSIATGKSFYEAVLGVGPSIDINVRSVIAAGESSGSLASALADAVEFLRSKNNLKKKMKTSLIYPVFLITFTLAMMVLFGLVVVPLLGNFVAELGGGKLPAAAQMMQSAAKTTVRVLPIAAILIVGLSIYLPILRKSADGKRKTDAIILRLPLFSSIAMIFFRTNMTNLMKILLSNGVNLVDSLHLVTLSIDNSVLRDRFSSAMHDIMDGKGVAESFEKYGILDLDACSVVAVGEKISSLAFAFRDINKSYDENLKAFMKKLMTTVTSSAMGIAFLLVGILAVSIVQMIAGMASSISLPS